MFFSFWFIILTIYKFGVSMQSKAHILVVDDDTRILKLLKKFLDKNGFMVTTTVFPSEAITMMQTFIFDLIILDVMMPEIKGTEFARQIRNFGGKLPIIMLTALAESEDRVKGLESGVNDYVTKPFEPRELLLRINNLINSYNYSKREERIIRFGSSYYNLDSKNFVRDDKNIKLSTSEQKLMDIFVGSKGQIISREELLEKIGGSNLRSVDVQIVRLRSKIEDSPKEPKYLKTIRNQGYVLYT